MYLILPHKKNPHISVYGFSSLNQTEDYSATAQCTGNWAYLEPNSNTMQKPIEGVYPYCKRFLPKMVFVGFDVKAASLPLQKDKIVS